VTLKAYDVANTISDDSDEEEEDWDKEMGFGEVDTSVVVTALQQELDTVIIEISSFFILGRRGSSHWESVDS
jgi:hypothetical protein